MKMKCANCGKELTEETLYCWIGESSYCSEDCACDDLQIGEDELEDILWENTGEDDDNSDT